MRKEEELQRAMKAYKEAVGFADKLDHGVANSHHANGNDREHISANSASPRKGPRPSIAGRTSITQYSTAELTQMLRWIASDGQLRTDDQIVDEMVVALGFSRRGTRIEKILHAAIASWRPGP